MPDKQATYPDLVVDIVSADGGWALAMPEIQAHSELCCYMVWKRILADKKVKKPIVAEIAVYLSTDAEITKLNAEYRHKNNATNVLSFPMFDGWEHIIAMARQVGSIPLGDIVIARETIEREAAEQAKTFRDHYSHMLIHGLLHLCGYDHEDEQDAEIMESLEADVLKAIGISNPYS